MNTASALKKNLISISSSMLDDNFTTQSSQNYLKRKDLKSISPTRTIQSITNSGEKILYTRSPMVNKKNPRGSAVHAMPNAPNLVNGRSSGHPNFLRRLKFFACQALA